MKKGIRNFFVSGWHVLRYRQIIGCEDGVRENLTDQLTHLSGVSVFTIAENTYLVPECLTHEEELQVMNIKNSPGHIFDSEIWF
jgi:hypothetical protein